MDELVPLAGGDYTGFVLHDVASTGWKVHARITVLAPAEEVLSRINATVGIVEAVDADGNAVWHQQFTGPIGLHNITAVYSGDGQFAGSTSSAVGVTDQEITKTILSATATDVSLGQSVTFTATV